MSIPTPHGITAQLSWLGGPPLIAYAVYALFVGFSGVYLSFRLKQNLYKHSNARQGSSRSFGGSGSLSNESASSSPSAANPSKRDLRGKALKDKAHARVLCALHKLSVIQVSTTCCYGLGAAYQFYFGALLLIGDRSVPLKRYDPSEYNAKSSLAFVIFLMSASGLIHAASTTTRTRQTRPKAQAKCPA